MVLGYRPRYSDVCLALSEYEWHSSDLICGGNKSPVIWELEYQSLVVSNHCDIATRRLFKRLEPQVMVNQRYSCVCTLGSLHQSAPHLMLVVYSTDIMTDCVEVTSDLDPCTV